MRLTATVGHYGPRRYEFDTDSPLEALRLLADRFESYEGTRNPWPSTAYPLTVEFHEDEPEPEVDDLTFLARVVFSDHLPGNRAEFERLARIAGMEKTDGNAYRPKTPALTGGQQSDG